MVQLVKHDLEFILKQIRIAEAHAAGGDLATLIAQAGALEGATGTAPSQASLLPYGLRTVDGSYNNILPGREQWGAADQPFKQLLTPVYLNDGDGDSIAFSPTTVLTNNDYGAPGDVADADPRIISNLIVDQTTANPAALSAMSGDAFTFDHDGNADTPDLVFLPNVSPDIGDSAPFNSWFTLFGQFFDHGLDLVSKGGNGTVYVPLQPDDPLYVEGSHTNFMVLTRASPDPVNKTTAWIDQNQTYGSHASKQIFMREYVEGPDGKPIATGHLLEGVNGGLATWADIKAQAANLLGIQLTDADVGNIPLLASDPYGNFIPGANGYPQLVVGLGPDGELGTLDDVLLEGDPAAPVSTAGAIRTAHAFLDDIAHNAVPLIRDGALLEDEDLDAGNSLPVDSRGNNLAYDDELLDAHYVTGDGRGNENIGLTAVHHVFHSEHNRIVEQVKYLALQSGDLDFLNEWLLVDVSAIPATVEETQALVWDGERLFQAARFTTEMEYQHLVFEEFARKIQPDIDVFVFEPSVDIDPSITAEFAHVVYRFGHSMLTEDVARINMVNGQPVSDDIALIQAFLNPLEYASMGSPDEAAGAIVRGMTRQTGNEIDEFVTPALRNNLLGLPLDLATINIIRGRDTGVPSLNAARTQFFAATSDTQLKPYDSWVDFAQNLRHPASIINFIAAYGTHETITAETTLLGKRAAATALVLGQTQMINDDLSTEDVDESRIFEAPEDRVDFLNSTGAWASRETGLNTVDFWIGGLAEKRMDFGGMLGSTFAFVFEMQMENLQDADRFYYLSRTQGLNLLNELENNSFSELIMRNTDLGDPGATALPGDSFASVAFILEMDKSKQIGEDPQHSDPLLQALSPLVVRRDIDGDGDDDYFKTTTTEHTVIGGTEENDIIISGEGDDTLWGRGGDDYLEGGYGVDQIHGEEGDDIIVNAGTDIGQTDLLHGGAGNDFINGGSGLALVFGNEGKDFLVAGPDGKQLFGGTGDDFILGGDGGDFLLGNEGDDWIEGGPRFDVIAGENSELFFNSTIIGHDVMNGQGGDIDYDAEAGDDIMFQAEGIQRNNGMAGFDWAIHKGDTVAANSDLGIPIFVNQEQFILRDRFDLVEGLSGWKFNDVLTGRQLVIGARDEATGGAAIPGLDAPLESYSNALLEKNVDRIAGLRALFGHKTWDTTDPFAVVLNTAGASDILLGGGGSDLFEGKAANDVIDGDKWLNVRISVRDKDDPSVEIASYDTMAGELQAKVAARIYNPSQLVIVREIIDGNVAGDIDIAKYSGVVTDYSFSLNVDGSLRVVDDRGIDTTVSGDTLRNIEMLRFSDGLGGTIDIPVSMLLNFVATGAPTLSDMTPTESGTITVSLDGVVDPNGLPSTFTVVWERQLADGSWVEISDDTAFTPTQAAVGFPIRAVVSFFDQAGFAEQVISAATAPVRDLILGNNNANTLNGTAGADELRGLGGDDVLNGLGGDDILDGGAGKDKLDGGTGADEMRGGTGDDSYFVENAGDQVIELAGEGRDEVNAYISYILPGNVENLILRTGGSFDATGNALANMIIGNSGANRIDGGGGLDTLTGGGGADIFLLDAPTGSSADKITDFLPGTDRLGLSAPAYGLTIGGGVTASGGLDPDWLVLGTVATAAHAQFLYDSVTGALLFDSDGTDLGAAATIATLKIGTPLAETDFLLFDVGVAPVDLTPPTATGTAGNVTVDAASHSLSISYADAGGSGVDAATIGVNDIVVSGSTAISVTAVSILTNPDGSIIATYSLSSAGGFTADDNGLYSVSLVGGSVGDLAGNAVIADHLADFTVNIGTATNPITGTPGGETLNGTADADAIIALGGDDVLNGLGGNDILDGGAGKDKLDGGAGADEMRGGTGDDIYFAGEIGDQVIELAGEGKDEVNAYFSYILPDNVENLVLRTGASFDGTGNALANSITGNNGANILDGGAGDDLLIGAGGADILTGGADNDVFDYNALADSRGAAIDYIVDFTSGADRIDLATIDADSGTGGNQVFSFIGTGAFSSTAGELRIDTSLGDRARVLADVDGDAIADMEIQIEGSLALAQADFVL